MAKSVGTSKTTKGVPASGNTYAPAEKRPHQTEHAPAQPRNHNQTYKI